MKSGRGMDKKTPKVPIRLWSLWTPALESGYATPDCWQSWADRLIDATSEPPIWLLDLSLAGDHGAAEAALSELGDAELVAICTGEVGHITQLEMAGRRRDDLAAGYHLLKLREGRASLSGTLIEIGCFADAAQGISAGQCEIFFDLGNRLSSGVPEREVLGQLEELLAEYAEAAAAEWTELQAVQALA
jgi:hypothetical protein